MTYDVQIGNTIRRGLSYAELITYPIEPDTFIRRSNATWIQAKDCVELTHILAQYCPPDGRRSDTHSPAHPVQTAAISQTEIDDYSQDEYDEDEIDYYENEEDEIVELPQHTPRNQRVSVSPVHSYSHQDEFEEERIFIPTAEYFKCKHKRKAAIIGICTLGLAGLSLMGVCNIWNSNIFAGTSFSANEGIGFVLKCLSFIFLTALIAIPYFIFSVFALMYYSIRLHNLKR